jgi:ribosome assembly protein RRB1
LCFNWHTEPITSIAFQPNEESVIAVASEDNRLSIWDMSVENEEEDPEIPNELMFLHQGQDEIKEIKFHPIYF